MCCHPGGPSLHYYYYFNYYDDDRRQRLWAHHATATRMRQTAAAAASAMRSNDQRQHEEEGERIAAGSSKMCLCSPSRHPRSFRCRHHQHLYVWSVKPVQKAHTLEKERTLQKLASY